MSLMSDARIIESIYDGKLSIKPFVYDNVQPASIDLTLNSKIKVVKKNINQVVQSYSNTNNSDEFYEEIEINKYIIKPNNSILAEVREFINFAPNIAGKIENRSSLARLGLEVSSNSFIHPGYSGKMLLLVKNIGMLDIEICKGMRICQLCIYDVKPASKEDYSKKKKAKYQGEKGIELSKLHLDEEYQDFLNNPKQSLGNLGEFLLERLNEKSEEFIQKLTPEQKEKLGL